MLKDARVRLAVRAILAGVIAGATLLGASDDPLSKAVLVTAGTTAFWTAVESFTPLNAVVGWFKNPV